MGKKITKKFIIDQTILYIAIVLFIIIFKSVFGDKNTLIGVTTVTAMLMFMGTNLTISPVKNISRLIAINLFIGIAAYIANLNTWIGIPINFIAMFIISYTFYYNLKTSLYLPFSLQYLFLLATPVTTTELPIRLASLLVGPVFIMILQFIINKNKVKKSGNKIFATICDDLLKKLNENNNEKIININKNINNSITSFKKIVYDNRKDGFYITEEGRIKLDIIVALEKISILIDSKNEFSDEIKNELFKVIYIIKENFSEKENIQNVCNTIEESVESYVSKGINKYSDLEVLNTVHLLNNSLKELKELGEENYNKVKLYEEIPERYKKLNSYKNEFYNKSTKFSYAIRVSLSVTIAAFIADYFQISEGRWIFFTAFSLIVPIYEHSKKKTRDRIEATVIGGIVVLILFTIFESTTIRMIILMAAGYIKSYTESYKYGMIFTTVSAIGAAAITGGTVVFTVERIIFIIFGGVIAILINKFVLPVKISDANRELDEMYADVVTEMIHEIYYNFRREKNGKKSHEFDNMLMTTSLIEDRFVSNNNTLQSLEVDNLLQAQRRLIVYIHELNTLVNINEISNGDMKFINQGIDSLNEYESRNITEVVKQVEEYVHKVEDIKSKIILINIREILMQIFEIDKLRNDLVINN